MAAVRKKGRERVVRPFDFRRPNKLSREHVRALSIVQEAFTRGVGTQLASVLRAVSLQVWRWEAHHVIAQRVYQVNNPVQRSGCAIAQPLRGRLRGNAQGGGAFQAGQYGGWNRGVVVDDQHVGRLHGVAGLGLRQSLG